MRKQQRPLKAVADLDRRGRIRRAQAGAQKRKRTSATWTLDRQRELRPGRLRYFEPVDFGFSGFPVSLDFVESPVPFTLVSPLFM